MDTIIDFTLKQCAQLEAKDAAALLNPISPGTQSTLDLSAALQLLKPPRSNAFSDVSFNDSTLLLLVGRPFNSSGFISFIQNSLLSNPLNPFTQSLLSNPGTVSSNQNLDGPPGKRQCVESSMVAPAIQPISPSHTASTSSCGSAVSPQQCSSPWPSSIGSLSSPKKIRRKPPAPIPDEKKVGRFYLDGMGVWQI